MFPNNKDDLDNVIISHGINYQNPDTKDSLLHYYSEIGNISLLVYLLSKKELDINIKNNLGRSALFVALNEDIVRILILHKISIRSKDNDGKMAEEVNSYVNFLVNQKCNETKKAILRNLGINF